MDLVRRDTLQEHLKPLEEILTETLNTNSRDPQASSRSLDDNEVEVEAIGDDDDDDEEDEDSGCKIYYETICSSSDTTGDVLGGCERIPVRLCAEGCNIVEGEMTCER